VTKLKIKGLNTVKHTSEFLPVFGVIQALGHLGTSNAGSVLPANLEGIAQMELGAGGTCQSLPRLSFYEMKI